MSDVTIGRQEAGGPFKARVVALLLAFGILAFVGLLVMGAYAPDLRSGKNGGGHALSNGATGFAALVQLAEATGRNPRILRDARQFDTEDLLVITPESDTVNVSAAMYRGSRPTLVVLPKWSTARDKDHAGWVTSAGPWPLNVPKGVLAPDIPLRMTRYRSGVMLRADGVPGAIQLRAPRLLQVITGLEPPKEQPQAEDEDPEEARAPELRPLITDGRGGIVLAQVDDTPLFILSDPDILSNMGMRDLRQADSAMRLLDWMNSNPPEGIAFDVSLNGFGHSQSPLKLMFEPPFLAMTICIALALLLAGAQALARFGPIPPRVRAIAFGKAALVDNSAALIRRAGREARLGGRYAAMIRERAVTIFGVPARLCDEALDAYLDQLKGRRRFTELAAAAEAAGDRQALLDAARALHAWQQQEKEE